MREAPSSSATGSTGLAAERAVEFVERALRGEVFRPSL
jgi:hypothetical protein